MSKATLFWLIPCSILVTSCNNKRKAWEVFVKLSVICGAIHLKNSPKLYSLQGMLWSCLGVKKYFPNSLSVVCLQVKFTPMSLAIMARFAHIYQDWREKGLWVKSWIILNAGICFHLSWEHVLWVTQIFHCFGHTCTCLRMTLKAPQIFILGLEINFSE